MGKEWSKVISWLLPLHVRTEFSNIVSVYTGIYAWAPQSFSISHALTQAIFNGASSDKCYEIG